MAANTFAAELKKLESLVNRLNRQNKKAMRGGTMQGALQQLSSSAPIVRYDVVQDFSAPAGAEEMMGGADRGSPRTFKLIKIDGKPTKLDHRATLYDRTVDGKKKSTPPPIVNAAKKIFRQLCKSQNKKGPDCKFNFTIVETTREVGADGHLVQHNERTYIGKIVKKKKATKRKIGKRTVTFKYDTIVDYVPMEDAKEMKGGRQLHFLA